MSVNRLVAAAPFALFLCLGAAQPAFASAPDAPSPPPVELGTGADPSSPPLQCRGIVVNLGPECDLPAEDSARPQWCDYETLAYDPQCDRPAVAIAPDPEIGIG